jgi:hypothetical protein
MPRGEKKAGGRPKGSLNKSTYTKEAAKEALRQIVLANMEEMTAAQMAASKGLNLIIVRDAKNGRFLRRIKSAEEFDLAMVAQEEGLETLDVWAKEPSTPAYSYLMDQAIDKPVNPKQEIEVGFKDLGGRIKAARERVCS